MCIRDRNGVGDWLKVQTPDGKTGWMASSHLQVNVLLDKIREVSVPPTPTPSLDLDGVWVGTTSSGTQIKMDVLNRRVQAVRYGYDSPAICDHGQFVFWGGLRIDTEGRFAIENLLLDNGYTTSFDGVIRSLISASGKVIEDLPDDTGCGDVDFTWNMHWDPHADPVCECNRVK